MRPTLERGPSTARCGDFCLLRFRPGPVHPSLDDLVVLSSPSSTISTPRLARTLVQHGYAEDRTPDLKASNSSSLQTLDYRNTPSFPAREVRLVCFIYMGSDQRFSIFEFNEYRIKKFCTLGNEFINLLNSFSREIKFQ